jgi:acetyl esterase/lipase
MAEMTAPRSVVGPASVTTGMPQSRAFRALPERESGSAVTTSRDFLVTPAPGTNPRRVSSSYHCALGRCISAGEHDDVANGEREAGRGRRSCCVHDHGYLGRQHRCGWSGDLGDTFAGDDLAPYAAAARRTDLSGLPPAFIAVGDIELFYAENLDYVRRLEQAGVPVELDLVFGAPHGFENWASDTEPAKALMR